MKELQSFIEEIKEKFPTVRKILHRESSDSNSVTVFFVVDSYNIGESLSLLSHFENWKSSNGLSNWKGLIFTSEEADSLVDWNDLQGPPPFSIITSNSQSPERTYQVLLSALTEQERLLQSVEQSFPAVGLESRLEGERLLALLETVVQCGLAIHSIPDAGSLDENWKNLLEAVRFEARKKILHHRDWKIQHLPVLIRAFIERHKFLENIVASGYFGDSDLELAQFTEPLRKVVYFLKENVKLKFMPPSEKKRRKKRYLLASTLTLAAAFAVALFFYIRRQASYLPATELPQGAQTGGILGVYYKGKRFENFAAKRTDRELNMFWPASPLKNVPADHFSVRWNGYLKAPYTEKYRFCLRYDDGAKFYIGDKLLIEDWRGGPVRTTCREVYLRAGWHKITVELFEHNGPAQIQLSWEYPQRLGLHPVPSEFFCCKEK